MVSAPRPTLSPDSEITTGRIRLFQVIKAVVRTKLPSHKSVLNNPSNLAVGYLQ